MFFAGVELPWCYFKQEMFHYVVAADDVSDDGLKRTLLLRLDGDESKGDVQELQVDGVCFGLIWS